MEKINRFLKKPLHYPNTKERWAMVGSVTLWVFLILFTLQPFGLNFAIHKLPIIGICTVSVFFLCLIFIHGAPLVFKKLYSPQNWTNGTFFLLCFKIISAYVIFAITFLSTYIDNLEGFMYYTEFTLLERISVFLQICIFVGISPICIIYYVLVRKTKDEEEAQIAHTINTETEEENFNIIELSGNTKDYVRVSPEDILYAKVSGNYVDVHYLENNCAKHKLLRISLNQFSDSLNDYPFIIRCHRAFMVNTSKLSKVHGNLKGYHLELENTTAKIPVSKSYTRAFKEKITELNL